MAFKPYGNETYLSEKEVIHIELECYKDERKMQDRNKEKKQTGHLSQIGLGVLCFLWRVGEEHGQ